MDDERKFIGLDWTFAEEHMFEAHGVTPAEAEEALEDPSRITFVPDYNSLSGRSVRIVGFCRTKDVVLTVIALVDGDQEYGVNAWPANRRDLRAYRTGRTWGEFEN